MPLREPAVQEKPSEMCAGPCKVEESRHGAGFLNASHDLSGGNLERRTQRVVGIAMLLLSVARRSQECDSYGHTLQKPWLRSQRHGDQKAFLVTGLARIACGRGDGRIEART